MSTDSKLRQAQEDLRRAEKAVQGARDEIAQAKLKAAPRITEADIVPGARFQTNKQTIVLVRNRKEAFLFIICSAKNMFESYTDSPRTAIEAAEYLTYFGFTKTPGKWVFEPEQERLKDGDVILSKWGEQRWVKVNNNNRSVTLLDADTNWEVNRFNSLEELEDHIAHPEKKINRAPYTREAPGA